MPLGTSRESFMSLNIVSLDVQLKGVYTRSTEAVKVLRGEAVTIVETRSKTWPLLDLLLAVRLG
jgi:nicotinate-nucleotide pyrophosphorylase